jgi:hypothetical protein
MTETSGDLRIVESLGLLADTEWVSTEFQSTFRGRSKCGLPTSEFVRTMPAHGDRVDVSQSRSRGKLRKMIKMIDEDQAYGSAFCRNGLCHSLTYAEVAFEISCFELST